MAEQGTKQPTEVLELTTVRQRQKIKIDGIEYEMRGWDEFDLDQYLRILPLLEKVGDLNKANLTTEQGKEIGGIVNQLSQLFLPDVPEKTFGKLTPVQKIQIVSAAGEGAATNFFEKMTAGIKAKGRSSSRGSKGSTGVRRKSGKR